MPPAREPIPAIRYHVAYYRDVYWLYRRAYHYYLYDPRAAIIDSGIAVSGPVLYGCLFARISSYAWGLSGYTALIIVITIQTEPLLTLRELRLSAVAKSSSALAALFLADLLFYILIDKAEVDRELDGLLVAVSANATLA